MKSINDTNHDEMIPLDFYLSQNYPNPFKEKTTIKYCVAYKTKVNIIVCKTDGTTIKNLVNEIQEPGTYEIEFKACNLQEGNYFIKITAGSYSNIKKMKIFN
jgi:hypothetical protein